MKGMKGTLLIGALFASMSASAGMWEKLSTMGTPTIEPTAVYTVETSGWDVRVYEWIPKDNPNMRCLFAGGTGKGGVACYPAVKKEPEK